MVAKRATSPPRQGRVGPKRGPVLIVLVVSVLLLVAAFGARRFPGAGAGSGLARLELTIGESLVTLIIILAILDVAFIVFSLWKRGHVVRLPPRRGGWMIRMLAFLAGFGMLLLLFASLASEPTDGAEGSESAAAQAEGDPRPSVPPWAWIVLATGLVGGLVAVWSSAEAPERTGTSRPTNPTDGEASQLTGDRWAYVIPAGSDPRSQIIQAFGAMEGRFAELGHHRRPSETPLEFAARLRADFPHEAIVTLTRLFVVARFSAHPITDADQRVAANALATVLTATRAPEPEVVS